MTRRPFPILLLAALAVACAFANESEAPKSVTMNGEYMWDQGGSSGDLEAVFTPTGDRAWDVEFNFTFRGEAHTYTGTASGGLTDGPLTGEVWNESRRRSWNFSGQFEDGTFSGEHEETTGGRASRTGTLTLGG